MPGWHDLPANDLRALAAYVRSLDAERPEAKMVPLSAGELSRATKLYGVNCAMCHGSQGQGNGSAAAALAPGPTDFWHVRPSLSYAENVLADGVPGTAMPPWGDKLDPAERILLAHYVRSFYHPVSPSE